MGTCKNIMRLKYFHILLVIKVFPLNRKLDQHSFVRVFSFIVATEITITYLVLSMSFQYTQSGREFTVPYLTYHVARVTVHQVDLYV
jgi:hypothetical protein